MIPQDYIQEVVRRNDIEDVVQSYVQLRRRGRTCTGLCPFHTEKTPSFVVYPETQSFYCFGCGAGGDVITFIKKISNLEYVEAVKLLASRVGMPMPNEEDKAGEMRRKVLAINRDAARYFYDQLNKPTPEAALAREYWRKRRGLSDNTIRRFGLGYAPDSYSDLLHYLKGRGYNEEELLESGLVRRSEKGNLYNLFRHRMITPIIDLRGNVIAFGGRVLDDSKPKYINSPETVVYKKSRTLFALNIAKRSTSRRYILCEGYMDVISMHQAGFDTAVCACGTALTPEQVKLIGEYADEVILSYDSDEAGQKAAARSLELFAPSPARVSVLNIPGAKDPDEFIKKFGRDRFEMLLNGTANATEFKLAKIRAKYDIATDKGRLDYIKEALALLAGHISPTEREVYAGRLAEETGISRGAIQTQLQGAVRRAEQTARRRRQQQLAGEGVAASIKVPYDLGGSKALGLANAEQQLVAAMLKDPAVIRKVRAKITPGEFLLPEMQQVCSAIFALDSQGAAVSLSALGAVLSEQDLAQLAQLLARNADLNLTDQDIEMFLARIRKSLPKSSKAGSMSADELQNYLQSLQKEKS
ncbi:MAG: DNA primase [Subdoligranulum sp.]|nr:DNA primase [Subdoligranulum sp.]MCI7542609.1 DNA primase [Subdoligranulum sp.]MDD7264669.1 DNA primase [Subdoligranulum sp.]